MAEIHEKCAVVGVSFEENGNAALSTEMALFALQHRGTEASGIAYLDEAGNFDAIRDDGMVKDVYGDQLLHVTGRIAIGHNRYATSGPKDNRAQPVIDNAAEVAFAHNGNLPVTDRLAKYLEHHNIVTNNRTDSEMMGTLITDYVRQGQPLPDAVELAYPLFKGAFTCVAMRNETLVAFRDADGIRPGVIGSLGGGLMVASETPALDIVGAKFERDIMPGEMVVIENGKLVESRQLADPDPHFDVFEIVYFMRPDSVVNGETVYAMRYRAGVELAKQHGLLTDNQDNILVVPIPDTSVPAAEGYADTLKLQHRNAIVKNRYVGRTFMQPTNGERQNQLRLKHNIIPSAIEGRDVVLIDDSIVRLNTLPNLVELAKASGAKSVSVLIASPPVRFPDFYGIDTPSQGELAAANLRPEQIREITDAHYLGYLSLQGLLRSTGINGDNLNLSCFTGEYPIGIGRHKEEIKAPVSMEYID